MVDRLSTSSHLEVSKELASPGSASEEHRRHRQHLWCWMRHRDKETPGPNRAESTPDLANRLHGLWGLSHRSSPRSKHRPELMADPYAHVRHTRGTRIVRVQIQMCISSASLGGCSPETGKQRHTSFTKALTPGKAVNSSRFAKCDQHSHLPC